MKAAVVSQLGRSPTYQDFPDPAPSQGEVVLSPTASALSRTTKSRASGTHYDASSGLPFVVGIDGVGRREDGTRVYFLFPRPPYGALAERTVVDATRCLPLPGALSDDQAAALANPGISSWAACEERARLLPGETVLINGGTGVAGRLAVQVVKHLGARKVVATGRNLEVLEAVRREGADVVIPIDREPAANEPVLAAAFREGIDVVLDYLWGPTAEQLLIAAARHGPDGRPLRYVSIGSVAGDPISLPGAVLRSSGIVLMGSGTGSTTVPRIVEMVRDFFAAAAERHWEVLIETHPLAQVGSVWSRGDGGPRVVLTIGP